MSESMSSSRAVTRFQHSARVLAQRRPTPSQRYSQREYAEAGGLMSYGVNVADAYRHLGVYAGRRREAR
jgi:hypothetical protein